MRSPKTAALAALLLALPAGAGASPGADRGGPATRIVVGADPDYPPYEFRDRNGLPAGFNVDLTRAMAEVMGLTVEFRFGTWSEIRSGLASGAIDVLEGQRAALGDFALAGLPYSRMREELPLMLDEMLAGGRRIKHIVDDLKDFARREDAPRLEPVELAGIARAAVRLLDNSIRKATRRFSVELAPGLPKVRGNAQRIEQVIAAPADGGTVRSIGVVVSAWPKLSSTESPGSRAWSARTSAPASGAR